MSQPLTEAAIEAIARNPNVTAAIERLATCYAESMHQATRTNATIRAEDEVLSRVGKAVWFCVHDATTGGARGEAPKAAPVTPRRTEDMTVEEMAAGLGYTWNSGGYWVKDGTSMVMGWPSGRWTSWIGSDDTTVKEHPTEHAALARLYAHQFPEPTVTFDDLYTAGVEAWTDGSDEVWWGKAIADGWAASPRCEGLALDPDDVCGNVPRWCDDDSPWLSPIGWEGAGGDCGGGA